jgi:hypothetical protein
MKKVKIQKKLFGRIQVDLKRIETTFFVITQSQKSLPAYTAQVRIRSKDKMKSVWAK